MAGEHEHMPKAVEPHFTEKLPDRVRRKSRLLASAGVAGIRRRVEDLLNHRGGLPVEELRALDDDGRKLVRRMALCPSNPDFPNRREAVSALALFDDTESFGALVALACDGDEDEVVVARALDGLAGNGGPTARSVLLRACASEREYVRNRALRAASGLAYPEMLSALRAAATDHPGEDVRSTARAGLAKLGVKPPRAFKNKRPPASARLKRGS